MRRCAILLTWGVLALPLFSQTDYWREIHFRQGGPRLYDAAFNGYNLLIAVGENGWIFRKNLSTMTFDSMQVLGGNCNLYGVDFGSEQVVYVVGEYSDRSGLVLKSTDGGNTWTELYLPPGLFVAPTPFYDVDFVNELNGWISGANGYVLKTSDGGSSWEIRLSPQHPNVSPGDGFLGLWVNPSDANEVWAVGDNSSIVAHTTDGGNTWDIQHYWNPAPVPYGQDSVSYSDVIGDPWNGRIVGSYGTVIDLSGNLDNAFRAFSDDMWYYAVTDESEPIGSGGLIPWQYSKRYDLYGFGGYRWGPGWAVGSNAVILETPPPGVPEAVMISGVEVIPVADSFKVRVHLVNYASSPRSVGVHIYRSVREGSGQYLHQTTLYANVTDSAILDYEQWVPYQDEYWYKAVCNDNGVVSTGVDSAYGPPAAPLPPTVPTVASFSVSDKAGDHGWQTVLTWQVGQPGDSVYLYRRGKDYPMTTARWTYIGKGYGSGSFTDTTAIPGQQYTYRIREVGAWVSDAVEAIGASYDDTPPEAAPTNVEAQTIGGYTVIRWNPIAGSAEPNLGGYDVCPYDPAEGIRRNRTILNASPVLRTLYAYQAQQTYDGMWQQGGVRAIDRSGNPGPWSDDQGDPFLFYVPGPGIVDRAHATGPNGSHRFLRAQDGSFYLAFTSKDHVWFKVGDGLSWTDPLDIGSGAFPAMGLGPDSLTAYLVYVETSPSTEKLLLTSLTGLRQNGSPTALFQTQGTVYWGISAPAIVTVGDTGFVLFETAVLQGNGIRQTPPAQIHVRSFVLYLIRFHLSTAQISAQSLIDSIVVDRTYTDLSALYADLGGVSIAYGKKGPYLLWDTDGTELRFYRPDFQGGWRSTVVDYPDVKDPYIAVESEQIYRFWAKGEIHEEVYYSFAYENDADFTSKIYNLSNTPDADSRSPVFTHGYVFWSEEVPYGSEAAYDIVYLPLSNTPDQFVNWSQADWSDAYDPQVIYYETGGQYYRTGHYVGVWTEVDRVDADGESGMIRREWTTNPPPERIYTLGDTLPAPITTDRTSAQAYGTQKGQSADVGNALSYQITDLDPQKSYTLGFYIYHEESTDVIERFYADGQPLKIVSSTPGTETYVEVSIPLDLYQNDSTIVVSVTKESGPTAILNEIYVFGTPLPSGGPMASESHVAMPRAFAIEWIRPLPLRGTGQVQLAIPRVATVTLDLYDITGRRVRRFYHGTLEPGYHTLTLRPEDDRGNRLASGVYFLRLKTPEVVKIRKVVWMP